MDVATPRQRRRGAEVRRKFAADPIVTFAGTALARGNAADVAGGATEQETRLSVFMLPNV